MDGAGCERSGRRYREVGGHLVVTRFIILNTLL